jgi:hypothetical protein
MNAVLEIVRFRAVPGADLATAARAVDQWLARQPGFVSRSLAGPDDEGYYLDVVRWSSLAQAEAAATTLMVAEEGATFLAAIDPATIDMKHWPIVIS